LGIKAQTLKYWGKSEMPFIEIKVFEGEYSEDEKKKVIEAVTDVMVSFSGENLRSATWVVIQEVKSGNWGIGGKALGLQDIRALQAGTEVSSWRMHQE
jgi:4-oxalocrotonate tautomerase